MNFKDQYLDALSDFSEAVSIRRQMIDPKKEQKINRLTKQAVLKIEALINSCKSIQDLEALTNELGLKFTKEEIRAAATQKPEILISAFMNELQLMLQEQIIPAEYEILDSGADNLDEEERSDSTD